MGTLLPPPVSLALLLATGLFFLTEKPWCTGTNQTTLCGVEDRVRQRDAVSHHGPIQPVLRHHTAATPAFLPLPPLGSAVLKPDLIWSKIGGRIAYRRRHSKEDASGCPWAESFKKGQLSTQVPDLSGAVPVHSELKRPHHCGDNVHFPLRLSRKWEMTEIKVKYSQNE